MALHQDKYPLTRSQQAALQLLQDDGLDEVLITGRAGSGKSTVLAHWLRELFGRYSQFHPVVVCAPTHKALSVLERFMRERHLMVRDDPWNYFKSAHTGALLATLAALLGLRPEVSDAPDLLRRDFGYGGNGILDRFAGQYPIEAVVVDEASMLTEQQLAMLRAWRDTGMRLILLGDMGQLPPVDKKQADLASVECRLELTEMLRQQPGSAILQVASAIYDKQPYAHIKGRDVVHTDRFCDLFLDGLGEPPADEEQARVAVVFRNADVDLLNRLAADQVYGQTDPAVGMLMQACRTLVLNRHVLVYQQERVRIEYLGKETLYGREIEVKNSRSEKVSGLYLPEGQAKLYAHPFHIRLQALSAAAQVLQHQWEAAGKQPGELNNKRKLAWSEFYEWKDGTLLELAHPFAMTAHKAQGSTYGEVFAGNCMLERVPGGLYVAVSRPRNLLVLN